MSKVIIGRPINGISINGLEYVMNGDDTMMYFDSIEEAKAFMIRNGYDEECFDDYIVFVESVGVCKRCGGPLFESNLSDYKYQCFECDEDFYAFEQEE